MSLITNRTIQLVLYTCLGYKEKEIVLVVTDEILWDLGYDFYRGIKELGIEVVLNSMKSRSINGEEPPPVIADAMKSADIALLITGKSLSHTQSRRIASSGPRKTRVASMPGAEASRLEYLLNVDYEEMLRHGLALNEALKKTNRVEIVSPAGTRLSMEIAGRNPHIDSGILSAPGAFGNLPAGEVYLAPLEGTTNGVLVIDGSMSGIGLLKKPIKVDIKDGQAVKISSPELRKILNPLGPLARNIAELGIGTNPHAQVVGNILEDEKAINTVHIAFGDNVSMGGKVKAPCHMDGVILSPIIKLNGKPLPERLVKWYPSFVRTSPGRAKTRTGKQGRSDKTRASDTTYCVIEFDQIKSVIGPKLYEMLFENSNDPQYVLDIKSQVFLEANQAFLSLSGYTREELVGKLKSNDLTPPNVQPVLIKKKEDSRKGIERDRYEFQMLTKSGGIKPVELSVHRIKLGGCEVTIGSVRDIGERLSLEKALREKITEIALAGNRLMALTEKIKNVPILTSSLLKSQTEDILCEQAVKLLCDPGGLRYKDAAIYFVGTRRLTLTRCSKIMFNKKDGKPPPKTINLSGQHRFAKIVRGELPAAYEESEILLPVKGLKQTLGLVKIIPDPKEKELMETNPTTKKGYDDVLKTIVSILGLLLEGIRLNKILEIQSIIDGLTNIYNRRYFEDVFKEEVERARRYRRSLSLFLIDLNKFKEINDTAGHKQGDVTLEEVAGLLKHYSRKVDIVCRYGGDEFAIILPETNLKGAVNKANILYDKIKQQRFHNIKSRHKPVRLTASFGVSTFSKVATASRKGKALKGSPEEMLLAASDRALYQAKRLKHRQVKAILPDGGFTLKGSP